MTDSLSSTTSKFDSQIAFTPDPTFDPPKEAEKTPTKQDAAAAKAEDLPSLYAPTLPKGFAASQKSEGKSEAKAPPKSDAKAPPNAPAPAPAKQLTVQEKNDGKKYVNGEEVKTAPEPPKTETPPPKEAPKKEGASSFPTWQEFKDSGWKAGAFKENPDARAKMEKAFAVADVVAKCNFAGIDPGPIAGFVEALAKGEKVDQAFADLAKEIGLKAAEHVIVSLGEALGGEKGAAVAEIGVKLYECKNAIVNAKSTFDK